MCEETQAYSFRETELRWLSYREAPLGRGWRAGKAATQGDCACVQRPPAPGSPWGKSALPEEPNPRKKRPARILTSGGSLRKKPTRHDHSTAQLSR